MRGRRGPKQDSEEAANPLPYLLWLKMAQEFPAERLPASLPGDGLQAWEELYDFLGPRVWPMLMQMLPDSALAEEVFREAFVQLAASAPRLRQQDGSLAVWFVTLARQLALGRLRQATDSPSPTPAGASLLVETFFWLPRQQALLQLEERMGLLKKIVNQLPKPQRKIVELASQGGCLEAEIATTLGMPQAKASTELRAAMSFLRHRLRAVLGIWTANI